MDHEKMVNERTINTLKDMAKISSCACVCCLCSCFTKDNKVIPLESLLCYSTIPYQYFDPSLIIYCLPLQATIFDKFPQTNKSKKATFNYSVVK